MTHGILDTYTNHKCRCDLCSLAHRRYEKRRKYLTLVGQPYTLPAHGFQRRVRALMALGWTHRYIAAQLDIATGNLAAKMRAKTVRRATHEAMCDIYERHAMTLPPDTSASRKTRALSARRGYRPPLCWLDIDDADETPAGTWRPHRPKTDIDEAVVLRVLAGDRLRMTTAERREVVTRARAQGWSEERIYAVTGIAKATDSRRYEGSAA